MKEINVLVIENTQEDAVFLETTLQSRNYKVWVAKSAEEAMKLFGTTPFAAVLTELQLSDKSASEITKEMMEENPNTNVVVITPYAFIGSAVEAMEEGAYGYIVKPFNPSEINIVIERAIERHFLLSSEEERKQFAELSVKDPLTGVYNRRFMKMYIPNKISLMKRVGENFSLLMVDIDFFKKYNESNGRLAGDDLLRKMCKLFRDTVRHEDLIFRYGGEEFLILLDQTDKRSAALVAERICNLANLSMPTTVSIGLGTYPDDGNNLDELFAKVDQALYRAKEMGRNRVILV